MQIKLRNRIMIKEGFDNLPAGICFFDDKGILILANKVMHQLIFSLTQQDIQNISDFDEIMKEPAAVCPGDGTVWRFQKREVGERGGVTEITAANITELYEKKRELEEGNREQQDIMRRFEAAGKNIVSITRSEENLAMKMRIHNELGYALGLTRQFIASNCAEEGKAEYIEKQRRMAKMLLGEIENDDETDTFLELKQIAEKLGMEIVFDGKLPEFAEELIVCAVRECLINTVRHAGGDKVFVRTEQTADRYTAIITNNGKPPVEKITEGGGLSSLRRMVEENTGTMSIETSPRFSVTITLLLPEEKNEGR